jgi:hypothetical protein
MSRLFKDPTGNWVAQTSKQEWVNWQGQAAGRNNWSIWNNSSANSSSSASENVSESEPWNIVGSSLIDLQT